MDSEGLSTCGATAQVSASYAGGSQFLPITSASASVPGGNVVLEASIYMSRFKSGGYYENGGGCTKRMSQTALAVAVAALEQVTCPIGFEVQLATNKFSQDAMTATAVQVLPGPFEYEEVPPPYDRVIARVSSHGVHSNLGEGQEDPMQPDTLQYAYQSQLGGNGTRFDLHIDSLVYKDSDVDGDGRFTLTDAVALQSLIGSTDESLVERFDVDNSNSITGEDVARLYRLLAAGLGTGIFGDLNGNGRLDCDDYSIAPSTFASTQVQSAYRIELDVELDGDNDSSDQAAFAALSFLDIDFNNNGVFPEDADPIAFFDVLAGTECASCDSIDINGNGVFPEDADVILFFAGIAGASCE
jgi:hypothetical protein